MAAQFRTLRNNIYKLLSIIVGKVMLLRDFVPCGTMFMAACLLHQIFRADIILFAQCCALNVRACAKFYVAKVAVGVQFPEGSGALLFAAELTLTLRLTHFCGSGGKTAKAWG
jgi:hypothetical protein